MSASPVSQLSQAAGSRAAVPAVSRVILLCVDGVSYDLLMPLVQAKLMPCAGELLSRSALAHVAPTDLLSEMALWSTVHCGAGPETHGRLDDVVFLHQQRQLLATSEQPLDGPSIHRTVAEHLGPPALVWPDGQEGCVRPWRHRPQELADLVRGIQQIDAWL